MWIDCALYFGEMEDDEGKSKHSITKPGDQYGMEYCEEQCRHDMKFINGKAKINEWKTQETNGNSGNGHYGTCYTEMDI
jgi:cellulose 1,4-beta-cellobiosidase